MNGWIIRLQSVHALEAKTMMINQIFANFCWIENVGQGYLKSDFRAYLRCIKFDD